MMITCWTSTRYGVGVRRMFTVMKIEWWVEMTPKWEDWDGENHSHDQVEHFVHPER